MFISESSSESERAEVDQLRMFGVVIVLFRFNARTWKVIDGDAHPQLPGRGPDHFGELEHGELFGELVKDPALSCIRRVQARDFDAANGIANIKESARLPALSINGERMSRSGLDAEAVEHRSKNVVVIETVDERFVQNNFIGYCSIDYALIQVRGSESPDFAGEHHVVAVMHLGEVIEGARLFRKRQQV